MRYVASSIMLTLFGVLLYVPGFANNSAPVVKIHLSQGNLNGGNIHLVKVETDENGQTSSTKPPQGSVVADPDSPNVQKRGPKPGTVVADPDSPNVTKRRPKPGEVVADPDSPNVHPRRPRDGKIPTNRNKPGRPDNRHPIKNRQR